MSELSIEEIRGRIRSARRAGMSNWLWPDVAIGDWRNAMADIAAVTSRLLVGGADCCLAGHDARALGLAGYTSGMGPFLGYWIERGRLHAAADVEDVFRLHLAHNRDRMDRLLSRTCEIVQAMADAGVGAVLFKGMHTAFAYFPEPGLRPLSDIDLHIGGASMKAAGRVLEGLGLVPKLRRHDPYMCDWMLPSLRREPHTLVHLHRDDFWSVDVQGSLSRRLPTGAVLDLDGLLASSGTAAWPPSSNVAVPRQPLTALLLAAHATHGLYNTTLLRLSELVLVIRSDSRTGELEWASFLSGADAMGGRRFVFPALYFCERLVPGTVPADVLAACRDAAPRSLRTLVAALPVADLQPLGRHSFRERFMWVGNWREGSRQLAAELAIDPQGRSVARMVQSLGNKIWAVSRGRLGT